MSRASRQPTRRSAAASRRASCAARRPSNCREGAGAFTQIFRLCRSRHGVPHRDGRLIESECSRRSHRRDDRRLTLTRDDIENALRPAYAYVDALLDTPGAEYYLEQRVKFPTIPTPSVPPICRAHRHTVHVVDFKFGIGVRVLALYPDGDEDVINAQLLFYAAAARHSLPEFFAGVDDIVLTILQPQSIEPDAEMVRPSR